MKQLTCEMCGGTDLIKDGGVFVCQSCGCKYSVEEAKKMMIEGTVEVQGTVQVDNSAFVQKYLANARRAKEKEDWEETEKYYNMVEQNDPDNIEAIFYSAYGKAKTTLVSDDLYKRQAAFKVLSNCISIIDDHYQPERGEENKKAITDMAADLARMLASEFVYTKWKNGYGIVVRTNQNETYTLFVNLLVKFRESVSNIAQVDDQVYLHEALLSLYRVARECSYVNSDTMCQWIAEEEQWIAEEEEKKSKVLERKRYEEYWTAHPEERKALEAEKKELNDRLGELNAAMDALPDVKSIPDGTAAKKLREELAARIEEKTSIGVFKMKERNALQEKINEVYQKLVAAQEEDKKRIETEKKNLEEQIATVQGRLNEINAELTKER